MPTISVFFGIVVQMYWRDHPPPHLHAFYQGFEALFALDDGAVIAGDLPPAAKRIVRAWIADRKEELLANWQRARNSVPLELVPGAVQ